MQLNEIFEKVKQENDRSRYKHGLWKDLHPNSQYDAISEELGELADAVDINDVHGEHGEISEAIQVINLLCRRIMFLTGEENA